MNADRLNDLDERVTAGLVACNDHGGFASADCPRCAALNALSLILAALSDAEQRAAQAEAAELLAKGAARELGQRAAKLEAALRTAHTKLETDDGPVEVDISDYSDEWCAGFMASQKNAADVIFRAVLADLAAEEDKA